MTTSQPVPGPAAEPTAGERLTWMRQNSTRLIIALVVLVIAAVVVVFSFSLFSSSSANPGNTVASGIMTIDNDQEGEAILEVADLVPGESGEGTVSITNVGDASGDFTLTASNLASDPADFASVVTLVITDGAAEVYTGKLDGITTVDLGEWAEGETHEFTFTVTFDETSGNEFQGATSGLDFKWDATQSTS